MCVFVCVVRAGRQTDNSQIGQVGISHNEPCRGRKVELRAKKKKKGKKRKKAKEQGRKRERVMETGSEPETRPQKSNYRRSREGVGPARRHSFKRHKALPDMYSQGFTSVHTHINLPA